MVETATDARDDRLVETLSHLLRSRGCTIATAESLTGGQLASVLSAAPHARQWYRGGIVAYTPEVKYEVLQTPRGPVVNAQTAIGMARSVTSLMGADLGVALTGVGGPEPDEGEPPGTLFLATCVAGEEPEVHHYVFDGDPLEVMQQSIEAALRALLHRITAEDLE